MVDKKTSQQYLTFIDPKGLRNMPFEHPKLNFSVECKNLQTQLNKGLKDGIVLNSVILSETSWSDPLISQHAINEWRSKNVLFLDSADYLSELFKVAREE